MSTENTEQPAVAVRCTGWMGLSSEELDNLLTTAEDLARDLETKDPYGAEADGWRVRKLIEIVKACRPIDQSSQTREETHG